MFQSSRSRLLLYYLLVMAAILCLFSAAFFLLFSRSLYHQVDQNLETLVRVAVPSFSQVSNKGSRYLENLDEVPWRDIFNSEQQSLEWFDAQGQLIASQGNLKLLFPPQSGFWTLKGEPSLISYPIRTFTLSVSIDRSTQGQLALDGYLRSSQTTAEVQQVQNQFLWQLGSSILIVLGLIAISGMWLTKKALEPVMQSFKQLQQFTADASHELRGPLTAIKASVDVMRNHPERFQAKDVKKLAAIASATEQMTHLTQDLLFLARTEAKGAIASGEWHCISLDALLEDLFDWLEPVAAEKDIHFDYQCLRKAQIKGDRSQLSRLFANLLENALNYTPPQGRVTLHLALQNNQALVSVSDTGIGIPQQCLPFVFDRFWRADQARSHRQGGTGLGLSIARAIAHRHRGQITVKSQEGQGSCFQVYLPIYRPEAANSMTRWSSWKTLKIWSTLKSHQSLSRLKKSALMVVIFWLAILPILMIAVAFNQVKTFDGLKFPQGGSSFADEVVFYQPDDNSPSIRETLPSGELYDSQAALGIPNSRHRQGFSLFNNNANEVKLAQGGSLSLKFTNNLLSGDGSSTKDLWIFTGDQLTTPLAVAISQDGKIWQGIGYIDDQHRGIDLDAWGWGKKDFFSYVRLTHETLTEQPQSSNYSNDVTVDAVGAVSSITLVPSIIVLSPLTTPLSWGILAMIICLVLGLGVRYWWQRKHRQRNSQ